MENNRVFFKSIFYNAPTDYWGYVLELGAGVGHNLLALRQVLPGTVLDGVEVNEHAYKELSRVADHAYFGSLLNFETRPGWDLVFTKGVLIHIAPEDLSCAYEVMYECSRRYILICEYFSPNPVNIPYRGQPRALWKRDFAKEIVAKYPDLRVVDRGFAWSGDEFPQDDLNWFLLRKEN
jgi:spore coat polysaccharide biosynthesis protein SpsF